MKLFVVATPIGNLGDMTFRAVETLQSVDLIATEDTRVAGKLKEKFSIETPLTAFHSHSPDSAATRIIEQIQAGKSVALIADAGTPGISDPGYALVSRAAEAGVEIVPIPGCSAVITALSASGLPTDKFIYLGFLPVKKGRQTLLETLKTETRTTVFYESVHRIEKTICQLEITLGGKRRVVVARELTKKFEEFFRGTLTEAVAWTREKKPKGEFVVLLAGVPKNESKKG